MIQHLLNTTIIWLISLVLFDILLRRETYHQYNRVYLLATFLLGLLLPAYDWLSITAIEQSSPTIAKPLHQLSVVKQQVIQTAAPVASMPSPQGSSIDFSTILLICYLSGAMLSLIAFIREIVLLVLYYKRGRRSKNGSWTLIETGKDHGPFSFASYLFVSTRDNYTDEEWQIILDHELQHGKLRHWIDVSVLQVAGIICWFHPLVYAYQQRLRLLHEYQADLVGAAAPTRYGQFLLQQSLLLPAPVMTHSFNRSPIKDRIMMLTRSTSRRMHLAKVAVIFPLLATCFVCCSKREERNEKKKSFGIPMTPTKPARTVEVNGQQIRFSQEGKFDGPGNMDMYVYARPEQLNGQRIYDETEGVTEPTIAETGEDLKTYIFRQLKEVYSTQPDGIYVTNVMNMVIDEKGELVYYELAEEDRGIMHLAIQNKEIANSTKEVLKGMPLMKPATLKGKAVPYMQLSLFKPTNFYKVQNSSARLIDTLNERLATIKL